MSFTYLRQRIRSCALPIAALVLLGGANAAQIAADTFAGQALLPGLSWSDRVGNADFAVHLWPVEPDYWAELGSLNLDWANEEGNPIEVMDSAEKAMYTAVGLRPLDPVLWAGFATIRSLRPAAPGADESFRSAEPDYRRAIGLAPTTARFHAAYGTAALASRHYDLAENQLATAVRFDPTDGWSWYYLGQAYKALGKDQLARYAFDVASKQHN